MRVAVPDTGAVWPTNIAAQAEGGRTVHECDNRRATAATHTVEAGKVKVKGYPVLPYAE
ncbi:hypothetical protein AA103193_2402 [Tanticharoenia sakaeratensis NBRC 103193]|nr:hypothetical protein AA103193_2402 [Tanticharoenia sakaeratensis NBRC 103193]